MDHPEEINPYQTPGSAFEEETSSYEPTGTPNLDIQYLFTEAHEVFKQNVGVVLAMFVIYYGISAVFGVVLQGIMTAAIAAGISELGVLGINVGGNLISSVLQAPLLIGFSYAYALIARGERPEISMMFKGFNRFGSSVGLYFLYALLVLLGSILLIVPGIILALGLYMSIYLFPDRELGVVQSLKTSWAFTEGHKAQLFLVFLVGTIVSILGFCALCIGALYTLPLSLLAYAIAYNELLKRGVPQVEG